MSGAQLNGVCQSGQGMQGFASKAISLYAQQVFKVSQLGCTVSTQQVVMLTGRDSMTIIHDLKGIQSFVPKDNVYSLGTCI